jgi:hypothetical protein
VQSLLEDEDLKDRIIWRLARIEAFLEVRLAHICLHAHMCIHASGPT